MEDYNYSILVSLGKKEICCRIQDFARLIVLGYQMCIPASSFTYLSVPLKRDNVKNSSERKIKREPK